MFIANIYVCYEMFSNICVTGKLFFLDINELTYTVKLSIQLNRESRFGARIVKINNRGIGNRAVKNYQ